MNFNYLVFQKPNQPPVSDLKFPPKWAEMLRDRIALESLPKLKIVDEPFT